MYIRPSSLACTDDNRIRHRDWYVDEGAVAPISGFVASISDTLVKTWASTSTYFNDLSKTLHKEPSPEQSRSVSLDPLPTAPSRGIMAGEDPDCPVRAALTYPPEHIEHVAYMMASERLPDTKNRSRHRKTHAWSPRLQMTYASEPVRRKKRSKNHGKAYEITTETGQFVFSVLQTGLHGTCISRPC